MKENFLNNNYTKVAGGMAGLAAIAYNLTVKPGIWKGVGNYFLATIGGAAIGAAIYELTTKKI